MLLKKYKYLIFIIIGFLIIPLGLLTDYPAWGEWDIGYFKEKLGFIPEGIKNAKGLDPIIPDYSVNGLNQIISYYLSAFVGVIIIFTIFFGFKFIYRK